MRAERTQCRIVTWGGNSKDRNSTLGGVWFLGGQRIQTWSCSQVAYVLGSAELEVYALTDTVGEVFDEYG